MTLPSLTRQARRKEEQMIIKKLLSGEIKLSEPDEKLYSLIKSKWDAVAKPIDSLGIFEEVLSKMGAILKDENIDIAKKAVIVMCADNGVVEEGISQSGQEVTLAVAKAMAKKTSSVCKMAKMSGIEVFPVDIGINTDEKVEGLIDKKILKGTKNFAKEPAMSKEELLMAIEAGIEMAQFAKEKGYRVLCTGEMGIGNTTTSAALAASLLKVPAAMTAGKGSGLSRSGLEKKEKVIDAAIKKYDLYNKGVLEVMAYVGGLDIAGMAGVMIGGAYYNIPVVIDGVISSVAALCAVKLFSEVKDYFFGSHISGEPAAKIVLKELGIKPVIDAKMALGEGTGAVMFCRLCDTALSIYKDQLSFDDLAIEQYTRFEDKG
jgi:nicotinate-nucleotide--dimethylbenzimidazole phosphoribosyltransferase